MTPGRRTTFEQRLWSRIDTSGGEDACWLWTGAVNHAGYGTTCAHGSTKRVHRVVFEMTVAPLDAERPHVLHRCDVPNCCNPRHLFAGTHADNMADKAAKGRVVAPFGEACHSAKLTFEKADEIRTRRQSGERADVLSSEYGVSKTMIYKIARGAAWARERGFIVRARDIDRAD